MAAFRIPGPVGKDDSYLEMLIDTDIRTIRTFIETEARVIQQIVETVHALGQRGAHRYHRHRHSHVPHHRGHAAPSPVGTRAAGNASHPHTVAQSLTRAAQGRAAHPQVSSTRQALDYLVSRGWSRAQAAGIVANLQTESSLNPAAVGDSGHAYGIAQWHPDRQAAFQAFTGHAIRQSTLAEQLAFVDHELTSGNERAAGHRLRGATTAHEAGSIVSQYYERPANREHEAATRAHRAEQIFNGNH